MLMLTLTQEEEPTEGRFDPSREFVGVNVPSVQRRMILNESLPSSLNH